MMGNPTGTTQSYRIYVAVTEKQATVGIDEVDVKALAAKASLLRVERTQA